MWRIFLLVPEGCIGPRVEHMDSTGAIESLSHTNSDTRHTMPVIRDGFINYLRRGAVASLGNTLECSLMAFSTLAFRGGHEYSWERVGRAVKKVAGVWTLTFSNFRSQRPRANRSKRGDSLRSRCRDRMWQYTLKWSP